MQYCPARLSQLPYKQLFMNLKPGECENIVHAKDGKSSGNSSSIDPFRKSKLKQSELVVIGEVCCSRHLYCIHNQSHHSPQNASFSLNQQLLEEFSAVDMSAEPLIQYQTKPEVDMLAQMNIKKQEYELILKKCEEEVQRELKQKRLQQLQLQAKKALQKSKKIAYSPKSKWGHSIYAEEKQKDKLEDSQKQTKKSKEKQQKKEIELKPISQRIAQYKEQQMKKQQQQALKYQRKHRQINTKELQDKIQNNAAKILEEMKFQKAKKDQQKKILQAKIRALQLKSLEKVKNCKKKPFEGGEQFNLGDSQYSTFSARANDRKLEKKKKKEKPKVPTKDQQINTKKTSFLKKSSQNSKRSSTQQLKKTQQLPQPPQENTQQPIKGKYFIWNIPVEQTDLEKLQKNNDKVFMNIERLNQKSGKTFREQANQYLTKKMEANMKAQRQLAKTHNFMVQVQAKKQDLLRTFDRQQNLKIMDEPFWNQDQIFKPNTLQNFHFYTKVSPH